MSGIARMTIRDLDPGLVARRLKPATTATPRSLERLAAEVPGAVQGAAHGAIAGIGSLRRVATGTSSVIRERLAQLRRAAAIVQARAVATITDPPRPTAKAMSEAQERADLSKRWAEEAEQGRRIAREYAEKQAAEAALESEKWTYVRTVTLQREQRSADDFEAFLRALDEQRGQVELERRRSVGDWIRSNELRRLEG